MLILRFLITSLHIILVGCFPWQGMSQDAKDGHDEARVDACKAMADDGYQPIVTSDGKLLKCADTWEFNRRYEAIRECTESGRDAVVDPVTGEISCED
jgi:hypothetical protein